jgi:hypothetical protein
MKSNLNTLSEKLQTLSAEQITQVEDFVELLRLEGHNWELIRIAAAIAVPLLKPFGVTRKTTFTMPYETKGTASAVPENVVRAARLSAAEVRF